MISKLDPNLVFSVLSALVVWLYHRIRHEKQPGIAELLKGLAMQAIEGVTATAEQRDTIKARITAALYTGLGAAGLKRNSLVDLAVIAAVERAMGELAKRTMDADVARMAAAAQEVTGEFDRAEARGRAAAAAVFGPVAP